MTFNFQKEELKHSCTRITECFLFYRDLAESEIIIKSSLEASYMSYESDD